MTGITRHPYNASLGSPSRLSSFVVSVSIKPRLLYPLVYLTVKLNRRHYSRLDTVRDSSESPVEPDASRQYASDGQIYLHLKYLHLASEHRVHLLRIWRYSLENLPSRCGHSSYRSGCLFSRVSLLPTSLISLDCLGYHRPPSLQLFRHPSCDLSCSGTVTAPRLEWLAGCHGFFLDVLAGIETRQ